MNILLLFCYDLLASRSTALYCFLSLVRVSVLFFRPLALSFRQRTHAHFCEVRVL